MRTLMDDDELASVGPSIPASSVDVAGAKRMTDAWSDNADLAVAAAARRDSTGDSSSASPLSRVRKATHMLALFIVLLQALWAAIVPVKNIATVFYPTTRPDSSRISATPYGYATDEPHVLAGKDLVPLLNDVLEISLSDYAVWRELEESGTFDINRIHNLLSLDDFAVLAKYYALVLQSSEFPAGTFTPRTFAPASASEKLSLALRRSLSSEDGDTDPDADFTIDIACSKENAFLAASRCTTVDGFPCPPDYPQENEVRTLNDVDLRRIANDTGLQNNVGLLFAVDFFQQAMSAVVASRDWTTALESLNFVQARDEALSASSLSSYNKDGVPCVLERDAFLVAVQAAQMQTAQLDSCVAAELVVGQFYTRAFVLDMIQRALVRFGYLGAADAAIALPPNTEAVLHPIFAFDVHITSGARVGDVVRTHWTFLQHVHVATQTTVAAQLKLDYAFSAAAQVAGSSMRMLQYMAFLPELASMFEATTVTPTDGGPAYDVQVYKLIGASRSGIDTFKEPSTGANSWMVFPLAELRDTDRLETPWWSDEQAHAAWFQAQEADVSTAPFRVFDTHLRLRSTSKVPVSDDNTRTRCHRALFKVIGKLAYLALVRTSKPASYLMFMSEIAVDHYTWLLNTAFTEELVGESFFGGRVAFPYRSGPYTRKDDGSAWVVVPLLHAMATYFGEDTALELILDESDRSFGHFAKANDGDVRFPDTMYCHMDGLDTAAQTATSSDDISEIYAKIYPGLKASVADVLALASTLHTTMASAMALKQVPAATLTKEQVLGNPVITVDTEGFGPPTDWHASAFTLGLLKFWPPKTPLEATVDRLQGATRCYRMLELRYLNTTTRCFAEPKNVRVGRVRLENEAMRTFFLSNWSVAVVLNTMAWIVVLKYLERLVGAWRATQFRHLDVDVALQLSFQGTGVLSVSQSLLLLAASVPALLGFHVPGDTSLLPAYYEEQLPKLTVDVLVTLSMSWFVKVGFECCNKCINARRPVNASHLFRLRYVALALIFLARVASPDSGYDDRYLMWKLVATCGLSLLLGAGCTAVIFLPERRGKVVNSNAKSSHDAVLAALVKQNLPLSRYGVIGRTATGWSTAGLIVEGWKLARSANGERVLRKGAGEILLPKDVDADSSAKVAASEVEGPLEGTPVES